MSTEDKLASLHDMLTNKLIELVQKDEITAAELNVVRQFLKDNNVDALPVGDSPLSELISSMPESLRKSFSKTTN